MQQQPTIRSYRDGDKRATSTPWGPAQYVKTFARGVAEVGCSQHGGLRVSRALALKVFDPKVLACAIERTRYFWFEGDCAYMLVVLMMPELFEDRVREQATFTVKDYYPDEYTIITGESVALEESYVLQKRKFEADTKCRFVAQAAYGDWAEGVPKGMVKVLAKRASDGVKKEFVIPCEEYKNRSRFGYVFQEA